MNEHSHRVQKCCIALGIDAEFEKHGPSKKNGYKYNDETNEAPTAGTVTGQLFAEANENDCTTENTS